MFEIDKDTFFFFNFRHMLQYVPDLNPYHNTRASPTKPTPV